MKLLLSAFLGFTSFFVFAQNITMQNGTFTQCAGVLFDSGGSLPYLENENYTLTICPQNAGQVIQLNFTSFETEFNIDILTIFNGQTTTAPVLGSYSGTISPGIVQSSSASGCLTLQFVSDASSNTNIGWAAQISCYEPCQTILSQIDTAVPTPNSNGYIRVCPNEQINLSGSGQFSTNGTGATYEWDLGDGTTQSGHTATFSYATPGVYFVNLNISDTNSTGDPTGCKNTNLLNQVVQVATAVDFKGTVASETILCFGESTTIEAFAKVVPVINECTPPVSEETFLPDGNGVVYETSITVDCFDSEQTLDTISQLEEICLVMEHSFLGDLDIDIISPTGQTVKLHNQGGESANLGLPWATGEVDDQSHVLTPGQGYKYCFVPGNSFPSLAGGVRSGGVFESGNGPSTYTDLYVPAGNYSSINSLEGLLGSTLNGSWTIRVTDNTPADNGYIFSWVLNFDPALEPPNLSFTPTIVSEAWDADSSIINTSGDTITVQPTSDGIVCYTYRVLDDFGCEYTKEVCIEVFPELIYATPNDLLVCTTLGTTSFVFDLTQNDAVIIAPTPNPSNFVLTYHRSQEDADSDSNPISAAEAAAFTGTHNQIVYGRFEYLSSGCYETVSFRLTVFVQPSISTPIDYTLCDTLLDGDDTNGVEEFDLSTKISEVLGTQLVSEYDVTFYYDQAAANAGVIGTDITAPIQNTSNPQSIFVRIENTLNVNCFETSSFQLIVNPLPVITPEVTLKQCDTDVDGITDFNLIEVNQLVSATHINEIITYYLTETEAETGFLADQIVAPTVYTNPSPVNSTVYARVETLDGCFRVSKINLVVGATQIPSTLQLNYFVCDDTEEDNDNSNGVATFDFSDATDQILAIFPTGQDLKVSYYISETDALAEINPIQEIGTHRNTASPNSQNIYARVDSNDVNACLGLGHHITLNVDVLPDKNSVSDYVLCSDSNQTSFDLTSKATEIRGNQTTPILISYHLSEEDAINNSPIPSDPMMYLNISNPQTIYVRVQFDPNNNRTLDERECVRTDIRFDLISNLNPILFTPDPIITCNNQVMTDYDLTVRKNQITANDTTISLTYYESQQDLAINTPITDPTSYTSDELSKTIIVLATAANQCTSTTQLELNTILYEALNTMLVPIEECEIDNNGFDYFDITLRETAILNGLDPTDFELSYYENESDALAGNSNTIPDPKKFENASIHTQEIYVRVKPLTNDCFFIIPLTLIVNSVPEIDILKRYVICLNNDDQVISSVNDTFIPNPPIDTQLNPAEYSFQWYMGSIEAVNRDPASIILAGATGAAFSPLKVGTYTVLATNRISGCRIPASTEVVSSYPPQSIDVSRLSTLFSDNNTIEVSVIGKGFYEYRVDFGPWQKETIFTNVSIGEHLIYARDLLNCNEILKKEIVIGYPTYFTPNGDGYNDTWNIVGISREFNAKIYIFDRYGKLLKQLHPTGNGWDGRFNGKLLPTNDYWFTLDYKEPTTEIINQFRAHFTLKR